MEYQPGNSKKVYEAFGKEAIKLIEENPFTNPPSYEKLVGIDNTYSRRINIQHRLVYQVLADINTIKIIRMWTHYE